MTPIKEISPLEKYIIESRPTIYTLLRHVSASGLSRRISCYVVMDNTPYLIDYLVAEKTGYKLTPLGKGEGIKVSGCGMDMGYHLVYQFSRALFGKESGTDSGYNLAQRWL